MVESNGLPRPRPAVDLSNREAGLLSELISRSFHLSENEAHALIARGAVYCDRNRVLRDTRIAVRAAVRVHAAPRVFREVTVERPDPVAENDQFLVVEKPAGIPVHPTCDNAVDNVLHHWETRLMQKLWVCHRLDIGTEGLLVIGKSLAFRAWFGARIAEGGIQKHYRAWVARPVTPGAYLHYQPRQDRAPFEVRESAQSPSDRRCDLTVLACEPCPQGYELLLEPHSGRKHQIRSQLARLGSPILGDVLYGSSAPWRDCPGTESFALQACGLDFTDGSGKAHSFQLACRWNR